MNSDLLKKYQYLFDPKYRDKFLVRSLAEFNAEPLATQPLLFLPGKAATVLPIKDCGEPLYDLRDWLAKNQSPILLVAGEAEYGAQNLADHALRQGAAERLLRAEQILKQFNKNFTFKITDSFRSLTLQKQYFDKVTDALTAQGLFGEELYIKTAQVIADPANSPPHSTGGALDLTVYNLETKTDLAMGSILDDIADPLARTFHPDTPPRAKENRLMLYSAMIEAGFVNSPSEWWHYSYGDRWWAIQQHKSFAIYGSYIKNN